MAPVIAPVIVETALDMKPETAVVTVLITVETVVTIPCMNVLMDETIHDDTESNMLLNQPDICPRMSVMPCVADAIRSRFTTWVIWPSLMISHPLTHVNTVSSIFGIC
jgi:hypothetical protein